MFVTQLLSFILHVLCPRFDLFSVPFWQYLEKKQIPVSEVESKLKKVKVISQRFFSLTCHLTFLIKSNILTRKRTNLLKWLIVGIFDIFTSISKFSHNFFLITITVFNKNANLKKRKRKKSSRYRSTVDYQVCSCQGSDLRKKKINETQASGIK